MHEHITNCSFSIYDLSPVHFLILCVSLCISPANQERVCANIPAEWRPHIIFCFCFSFMQTPMPVCVCVERSCAPLLKIVDRRSRHCHWIAYIAYNQRRFFSFFFSSSLCCWCRNVCFDDDVCSPRVILPISAAKKNANTIAHNVFALLVSVWAITSKQSNECE